MAKRICLHCKQPVVWMQLAPDGRKIPVNVEPDAKGSLVVDPLTGWLIKSPDYNSNLTHYRSHLLDCKSMAKALHLSRNVPVGKDADCSYPGCRFVGQHSHAHCFNCGEVGHFANVCENEKEAKELDFS